VSAAVDRVDNSARDDLKIDISDITGRQVITCGEIGERDGISGGPAGRS
jgi:hypothetical protein